MTFDLGTHFQSWAILRNHAHFDRAHLIIPHFCISVQEGRRDDSDTEKCSQWPHLYESYEATYT